MSLPAEALAASAGRLKMTVLLVSEDPETIVRAQADMRPFDVRVIGCVGPAHGPCFLDEYSACPLASHADVAIVDSPVEGEFAYHWKQVPAGTYAERLANRHRNCFVILAGAAEGAAGPTGEVACVASVDSALDLVSAMVLHPSRSKERAISIPSRREER